MQVTLPLVKPLIVNNSPILIKFHKEPHAGTFLYFAVVQNDNNWYFALVCMVIHFINVHHVRKWILHLLKYMLINIFRSQDLKHHDFVGSTEVPILKLLNYPKMVCTTSQNLRIAGLQCKITWTWNIVVFYYNNQIIKFIRVRWQNLFIPNVLENDFK